MAAAVNGVYEYPHVATNRSLWNMLWRAWLDESSRPSTAYRDALASLLTKFLIRTPALDEVTSGIRDCLYELRPAATAGQLVPVEVAETWDAAAASLRAAADLAASTLA